LRARLSTRSIVRSYYCITGHQHCQMDGGNTVRCNFAVPLRLFLCTNPMTSNSATAWQKAADSRGMSSAEASMSTTLSFCMQAPRLRESRGKSEWARDAVMKGSPSHFQNHCFVLLSCWHHFIERPACTHASRRASLPHIAWGYNTSCTSPISNTNHSST
jgi:hypothetical protein